MQASMVRYDFKGCVVFVTGGTSGIGLATARAFGRAGASVAVAARGQTAAREALRVAGGRRHERRVRTGGRSR